MKTYKHPILGREANDLKYNRLDDGHPYKIYANDGYDKSDPLFYSEKEIEALGFEEVVQEEKYPEWVYHLCQELFICGASSDGVFISSGGAAKYGHNIPLEDFYKAFLRHYNGLST